MSDDAIRWPAPYDPSVSPVHCVNRLAIARPADAVWDRLIKAGDWPDWYANASNVVIDGGADALSEGSSFTWTTFGVRLKTRVLEFVPGERIAWLAKSPGVVAYHAWLIVPTPDGCDVLTEETQHGILARAARLMFPKRMETWHQRWLEGLAEA